MLRQTHLREPSQLAAAPLANEGLASIYAQLADKSDAAHICETRAPFMRRFAAISIYDYICCLWLATFAVVFCRLLLGPELTAHAPIQLLTLLVFVFRDSFFNGRGLGKGLLGLAVIDNQTKRPATIVQSLQRNLLFLAPYFAYQLIAFILPFYPASFSQHFGQNGQNLLTSLQVFGISYAILVVLLESVLMLSGSGRRLADRLSGTIVVKR